MNSSTCSICLATAQARGGVALFSPGCCGAWYHQTCIDGLVAQGSKNCPMCRHPLPLPAAPVQQMQQQQQQQPFAFQQQRVMNNNRAAPPSIFQRMGNALGFTPAPTLESEEDRVAPIAATAATASTAVPTVTVSAAPEYNEVGLGEEGAFHVRVGIKYEEVEALSARKVPLDVVCVLDNSGSMTGSKLDSLKKAMDFVIQQLGPQDRLSVVNFNSHPTVLHGLLKMNAGNQSTAKSRIRALNATGGTNIYQGMQQGWSVLESRQTRNPASCLFLLTDGQDRDNLQQKLDLARTMKSAGTSLFVFGFGTDHDSEHMDAIANAAEGVFTYVESDSMVTDAFGGTIGAQQGVSLTNIQLSLEACEHNVVVTHVLAGRYTNTLAPDGRSGSVSFVNMFLGETRDVLLKLRLPPVAEGVADYELIRATATFRVQGEPAGSAPHSVVEPATCLVQRLAAENFTVAGRVRDEEVDVQVNRLECAAAVAEALREADNHNYESAKAILSRCKATVGASPSWNLRNNTTVSLMQETEEALQRVQNRSEYERGGRAMMQECVSSNAYQRTTYTKAGKVAKYQTNASVGMQSKASMF